MSCFEEQVGASDRIRAAIVVDDSSVAKWQQNALLEAAELLDIVLVLNCTNTATKKRMFRHASYYALNAICIKNKLTKRIAFGLIDVETMDFKSQRDRGWQIIPDEVVDELRSRNVTIVIKFGMTLLRTGNLAGIDVLSFHHGDPRKYRGRPAGFYEMWNGAHSVGAIVQKVSDVLDAGQVLAFGQFKIAPHSYKKTMLGLYGGSSRLLRRAIINYRSDRPIPMKSKGKNYRLPGNALVIRFCARMILTKCKRLLYGAFFEKKWNVGVQKVFDVSKGGGGAVSTDRPAAVPKKYAFYADPFFSCDGSRVRVEALSAATGRGEIIELDAMTLEPIQTLLVGPHFSYPYSVLSGNCEYIVPEVAEHEAPYLLEMESRRRKISLKGLERLRIVDPSIVEHEGFFYLFGGVPESVSTMLYLYVADTLEGPYRPHPLNPVVVDPSCARMGGRLLKVDGKIIRFGQNNCIDYGDGIAIREISKLSPCDYRERGIGRISASGAKGPHTVDLSSNGLMVFDFYESKFSLFAGYRRIAAKFFPVAKPMT